MTDLKCSNRLTIEEAYKVCAENSTKAKENVCSELTKKQDEKIDTELNHPIERYVKEIEKVEGSLPGFRSFLKYIDQLCFKMDCGSLGSRQLVALAYATYKLFGESITKKD